MSRKFYILFQIVFIGGLLVLPFVFWPQSLVVFEIPRVWYVFRWIEALAILGLFSFPYIVKKKKWGIDGKVGVILFCYVSIAIVSSILGVDPYKSLVGNYFRGDGLLTLFHLVALSILVSVFYDVSCWKYTKLVIALACLLTSVGTIVTWLLFHRFGVFTFPIWPSGATGFTFGNAQFLGGYILVSLPFVWSVSRKLIFRLLFLVLPLLALLTTRSYGSMLGVCFFFFLLLFFRLKTIKIRAILCLLLVLSGCLFLFMRYRVYDDFVAEGRERILIKVLLGVSKRPIFGYGVANTDYAFEKVDFPYPVRFDVYVDKAHSTLLEAWATTGVVGFLVYVALLWVVGKKLWKGKKDTNEMMSVLFLCFVLYLYHAQTNIISITEEIYFWIIVGMGMKKA